jgi:hypothetical protein
VCQHSPVQTAARVTARRRQAESQLRLSASWPCWMLECLHPSRLRLVRELEREQELQARAEGVRLGRGAAVCDGHVLFCNSICKVKRCASRVGHSEAARLCRLRVCSLVCGLIA